VSLRRIASHLPRWRNTIDSRQAGITFSVGKTQTTDSWLTGSQHGSVVRIRSTTVRSLVWIRRKQFGLVRVRPVWMLTRELMSFGILLYTRLRAVNGAARPQHRSSLFLSPVLHSVTSDLQKVSREITYYLTCTGNDQVAARLLQLRLFSTDIFRKACVYTVSQKHPEHFQF